MLFHFLMMSMNECQLLLPLLMIVMMMLMILTSMWGGDEEGEKKCETVDPKPRKRFAADVALLASVAHFVVVNF